MVLVIPLLAWGSTYLKKLKLSKRYKAIYKCSIDENYYVNKSEGDKKAKEQMLTHVNMYLTQEVLSNKKHVLSLDYILSGFTRKDSLDINAAIDTASNKGTSPLKKNILLFTDKGKFLGTALKAKTPMKKTRDYRYFHNASKKLVLKLSDSAFKYDTWHSSRTDTVNNSGFQLIFTYPLTWEKVGEKDTLDMRSIEVRFYSPSIPYFTTNNMLKALGIETYHRGLAAINGKVLVDAKTGRILRFTEYGNFIGNTEVKTTAKNSKWPSVYRYNKHFAIDTLIKKPRKKILGIF